MTDKVNGARNIEAVLNKTRIASGKEKNKNGLSFNQIYGEKVSGLEQGVKLSHHVQERFKERQINLDEALVGKINTAFQRAKDKGARESLLLIDDLALIASIKNKTIVTALDKESGKDHVFTNIDSAVIMK